MECSLLALLTCLSWGNVYVDGAYSYSDLERTRLEWFERDLPTGVQESGTEWRTRDAYADGQGRFAIGYELSLSPSVRAMLEAARVGGFNEHDVEDSTEFTLSVRWYPFRR